MEFNITSNKDAEFLINNGADPLEVYKWRLACEVGIYKTVKEVIQAGMKLIGKDLY